VDRDVRVVDYALTEDDMVAFANVPLTSTFLLRYSWGVLWFFTLLAAIVIFIAGGLLAGGVERWHDPEFRGRALAIIAAVFIGLFVFERPMLVFILRRRIRAGRYAEMMQQCRLQLSAEGVKSTSRSTETIMPWPAVVTVVASSAGVYLLSSTRRGYVVPRRAFPDPSAFAQFVRTARQLRQDYGRS
jgi:hypothetical protein